MPNWCENDLTVNGTKEELKKFDEQFKQTHKDYSGNDGDVDKDEVLNAAKSMKCIEYRTRPYDNMFATEEDKKNKLSIVYLTGMVEREGYSFSNFVPMTKNDFLNGWYDWSVKNWGTKWDLDTSDMNVTDNSEHGKMVYNFETAWSPCCPVVKRMSELFPSLTFTHKYNEEGNEIIGYDVYSNGKVIESKKPENDSIKAFREFQHDIFGYNFIGKCSNCGCLLADYDYDDGECPNCEKHIRRRRNNKK